MRKEQTNENTYEKLKEETDMSQALEKLMGDRITARVEEGRAEGRAEGRREERADLLSRLQSSGMISPEQIATVQNWRF